MIIAWASLGIIADIISVIGGIGSVAGAIVSVIGLREIIKEHIEHNKFVRNALRDGMHIEESAGYFRLAKIIHHKPPQCPIENDDD